MTAYAFLSYGQGGKPVDIALSGDGLGKLNARIAALGVKADGPHEWDDHKTIAERIKALPADATVIVGGVSLGANMAPLICSLVAPRKVDYLFGIQASTQSPVRTPISANVKVARLFYAPWWTALWTWSLGSYVWPLAADNKVTRYFPEATSYALHPGDGSEYIHQAVLADVKALIK